MVLRLVVDPGRWQYYVCTFPRPCSVSGCAIGKIRDAWRGLRGGLKPTSLVSINMAFSSLRRALWLH
jgi:hypothetical protein